MQATSSKRRSGFGQGWAIPVAIASFLLWAGFAVTGAPVYLSEILFNPPGADTNHEYLELRGAPNDVLPEGTWFVAVEGDAGGNPGVIQNLIDLSGRTLGQNGFLVLFQRLTRYKPNPLGSAWTNADTGNGWGHGSSSSLGHRGEDGQTEFENASVTFLLITSGVAPEIGDDIDANNDGVADGAGYAGWTVHDAVGVDDGISDRLYGRINYRHGVIGGPGITGAGNVTLGFTPGYVARNGNTTGWALADWVAGDNLTGVGPKWRLAPNTLTVANTYPSFRAGAALNHQGGPNFGAPVQPAVLVREIGADTRVIEGGKPDGYFLGLTTAPLGPVTVRATAEPPLEISLDGRAYSNQLDVVLTTAKNRKVLTRVPRDNAVGPSWQRPAIEHEILATTDPVNYPTALRILPVTVTVTESNLVLLGEAKVNPPGTNDGPFEYIELIGPTNAVITNLHVLAVAGGSSANPGLVEFAADLSGQRFGRNGHLILAGTGHPYLFTTNASVVTRPELAAPGGALHNGTVSILLVGSRTPIPLVDLDAGDNGRLEGLPTDAVIMDAVAWKEDGHGGDEIYGGVDVSQRGFTPDAVSRVPGRLTPNSAAAWMAGDLAGATGDSLAFDLTQLSTNLPPGSLLTPGFTNVNAPTISALTPLSHVLGDPANATVSFMVADAVAPVTSLVVTASSTNPAVVPDENLTLVRGAGGRWTLTISAIGVGYADAHIRVSNGTYTGVGVLHFAASDFDLWRGGAIWSSGVSDASTAQALDGNWMLIGDDENQVLRVFSRTRSGGPVAAIDLNSALGLVDFYDDNPARPKEVDIEASTRVGNRIYWLGSHSHSADTLERTNRARVFATDLSGAGTNIHLMPVGRYDFLKLDLLAWDHDNHHGKGSDYYGFVDSAAVGVDPKAPDGSGFNLEGLCMAPKSTTTAYLGFRAPLIPPGRLRALILPVTNFTTLVSRGGPPGSARFGPPIELDLGRCGIRSIEGSGTNYLIVAGPPGAQTNSPAPGYFRLFTWTGQPGEPPRERSADLSGLNVEGIVGLPPGPWAANTMFQLVSDAGATVYYGDGRPAKTLAVPQFKKFRTDWVELGSPVPVAVPVRVVRLIEHTGLVLEWPASSGQHYRLQTRPRLSPQASWSDYGEPIVASGALATATIPLSEAQCFLRVLLVPDQ